MRENAAENGIESLLAEMHCHVIWLTNVCDFVSMTSCSFFGVWLKANQCFGDMCCIVGVCGLG